MWTPDVYEGAPTAVTAFMAAAVKAAAFGALLRACSSLARLGPARRPPGRRRSGGRAPDHDRGNLAALTQTNVKRMLAYSSIAHAGYLLIGFAINSDLAPLAGPAAALLSTSWFTR